MSRRKDHTIGENAPERFEWIQNQWIRGVMRKRGWTPSDVESLSELRTLHAEWAEIAKDGPPELGRYLGFMDRYLPAYNAIFRRTNKGLCAVCLGYYTFAGRQTGEFCSEKCARLSRSTGGARTEPDSFQVKWDAHRTTCKHGCTMVNPCKPFLERWLSR